MGMDPVGVGTETLVNSTGEKKRLMNSVGEIRLQENHVGVDLVGSSGEGLENLMNSVDEERVVRVNDSGAEGVDSVCYMEVESDNLTNSVGEDRREKSNVGVDSVVLTGLESGNLMNSVGEERPVNSTAGVDMVDSMGLESGNLMDSVGEERLDNTVGVNSIDSTMLKSDNLKNSVGEERPEKNHIGVESVGSMELESGNLMDSVGEGRLQNTAIGVDSVASMGMISNNLMNSIGEKRLDNNDANVDAVGVFGAASLPSVEDDIAVSMSREGVENLKMPSVGEKRVDNSVSDDLSRNKKVKVDTFGDMKRVAEIVLVLSAMGNMRGGRSPTTVEKEFMAEAREKLVGLCEGMSPKDIVPRDAVRVVIEDLGLNRARDQRLGGFRPPMMSIKEKLQLTKRKMEESKKFSPQPGLNSTQMPQPGFGTKNENHGAFVHSTQRFPADKPSHIAVSAGGSGTNSLTVHASDMQAATVSRGPFGNPLERDVSSLPLPRTEAMHFRLDGRPNVSAYASQVRANTSGDHLLGKTPTFSPHQLGAVAKVGLPNKVSDHKVEGTPVMGVSQLDRNSNQSTAQISYGNLQAVQKPPQGLNFLQASPSHINHNEIAVNVQKFLHPRLPEHPSWTPPSTDYMNKSLTCHACKVSINDVESLLVCDACEKGYHIKCLQSSSQKGIPKGEWHCPICLLASNGKPLPPKYGRVTRNSSAPKVSSNAAAVQSAAEKKVQNSDQKVNHQKATSNGGLTSLHPAQVDHAGKIHITVATDQKMLNATELQVASSSGNKMRIDYSSLSGPKLEASVLETESLPKHEPAGSCLESLSEVGINTCHSSQTSCSSQDVDKSMPTEVFQDQHHNTKTTESRETSECKPGFDVRKDEEDTSQTVSLGNVGVGNGAKDCLKSSVDSVHSVDWVGDILQVVDEKAYYKCCRINGTEYKLQDHALFRSKNGSLRPSKLQALWEDTKTGSKWAIVNSCYIPADLPEVVGRPCSPEDNEVYESNHGSTVRAGLVQGPCKVLPPNRFTEESERRHSNDGIQPVFVCKWFYDESKGLFRPVTD